MTVRLFNFEILHLLYDIFVVVVVTICVFCHNGNKGFTYLLTYFGIPLMRRFDLNIQCGILIN